MVLSKKSQNFAFIHPIYLNTPMLLSFVATMEDGVTLESSIVQNSSDSKDLEVSADGEGGTNEILSVLGLRLQATGQLSRSTGKESSVEEAFTRQHTMASLLSRLLHGLAKGGVLNEEPEFSEVKCGDLIIFEAIIKENPLDRVLNLSQNIMALLQNGSIGHSSNQPKAPSKGRGSNGGKHNSNQEWKDAEKIINALREDQNNSPLVDLVGEGDFYSALITADREFFGESSRESLVGGRFKVVGKVSGILASKDEPVSLFRRGTSSLGSMRDAVEAMVSEFQNFVDGGPPETTTMDGPVIQILPLAIYI